MDFFQASYRFLKDRLSLENIKEQEAETIESVKRNVDFKGANLWILIFAILLASVGLNVNATAVIIGAMLISPLMGPIMGLGLGAAINDFALVKRSGKNLLIATLISIVTSAFYFFLTPLSEAQSELLSRVSPSIWDVLIAFFGGMAGIVAGSSREKGNVIPGVAIATALMPPLCTAGYGLATGQMWYFLGAFYLYFINTVFIFISTFIVIRLLQYDRVTFVDPAREKKVKRYIFILVLITVIPSSIMAYFIVNKTIFNRNASQFVTQEFVLSNTQIIQKNFLYDRKFPRIELYLIGERLTEQTMANIRSKMKQYRLENVELYIRQGASTLDEVDMATIKTTLVEDLYEKNNQLLLEKEAQIHRLRDSVEWFEKREWHVDELFKEMKVLFPKLHSLSFKQGNFYQNDSLIPHSCLVVTSFSPKATDNEKKTMVEWLKVRTGFAEIILWEKMEPPR
jgi:uncharacterized hydrophobic protein (TIGR00271 family)